MKWSRIPRAFMYMAPLIWGVLPSGCGGDGSGNTTFNVSTSIEGGGSISPTSATVDAEAATDFRVSPDAGFMIGSVTGCGGQLSDKTYTTGLLQEDCRISVVFTALPTVSVSDAEVPEGDSNTATLDFTVSLDKPGEEDISADYVITAGENVEVGRDYEAINSGTLTIPSGSTTGVISVVIKGDITPEADESLSLALHNLSAGAMQGNTVATGTIINDDPVGQLNDTGVTLCSDTYLQLPPTTQNDLECTAVGASRTEPGTDTQGDLVPAGQDALFGRDFTANDDSDGHAGFSFTYICNNGERAGEGDCPVDIAIGREPHNLGCTMDNVTGLMWESKTVEKGLRYWGWSYTGYNPDNTINGGDAGTDNGGVCFDETNCDTGKYVEQVNSSGGICGYTDWRLPTRKELISILDISGERQDQAVDNNYFPVTGYAFFWTSSPRAQESTEAWAVGFHPDENYNLGGMVFKVEKSLGLPVRLVRKTF